MIRSRYKTIVVATIHPWNLKGYAAWKPPRGYKKVLITRKEDLTLARLKKIKPRYIFFPHWSWIIPSDVYENFECVVFHMTNLPFGRGGSPMQNLIARGIYKTKVSAIRVEKGIDTGPVYLKRPFTISIGSAHELFKKLSSISFAMMSEIVRREPRPHPQRGRVVTFSRRTPHMSRIPDKMTIPQLYDFIRMLDAPGYPAAYIEHGNFRVEFRRAKYVASGLSAEVTIRKP